MNSDRKTELLTFSEARKIIPGRPDLSTIHRWANQGIKGIRLRTLKVGGRRFVSKAEIEVFIAALNKNSDSHLYQQPRLKRLPNLEILDEKLEQELQT